MKSASAASSGADRGAQVIGALTKIQTNAIKVPSDHSHILIEPSLNHALRWYQMFQTLIEAHLLLEFESQK